MNKTLESGKYPFEIALSWAVSAKNTLPSIHGYSPNQMVFGKNPNLPSILIDRPPALEGISSSEVIADNLNAMRDAKRAYIESESSEKLRRALRHQIRPAIARDYNNGDLVYYKRNDSARWMGPGTVIGCEAKQVLVKHGGTYVRVHPCRLMHCANPEKLYDVVSPMTSDVVSKDNDQSDMLSEEEDELLEPNDSVVIDSGKNDVPMPHGELFADQGQELPVATVRKALKLSDLPKPGQVIHCVLSDSEELRNLKIISRAGKATGSNKYYLNVVKDGDRPFCLDFENKVSSWEVATNECENQEESTEAFLLSTSDPCFDKAKQKELSSWDNNKVFTVVPDVGQSRISTRWICGEKVVQGCKEIKARLVAKGFQDDSTGAIRTDSPTCSKEGFRVCLGYNCFEWLVLQFFGY